VVENNETLINSIYGTGEWSKDFTEITLIALRNKSQTTKCSDHRTIGLTADTANTLAKTLRSKIERKTEDVFGDQFGFRRGKGTRDEIGMLTIILERMYEIYAELCVAL
jgi:hypothetical protein